MGRRELSRQTVDFSSQHCAGRKIRRSAAWQSLVRSNLRLVAFIATRYAGRGVELADLNQAGCVGLIHAADRFDAKRGRQFSTYAVFWIRREIVRAIANESRTIRLPERWLRDKARRADCARYVTCSLDAPLANDTEMTLADMIVDGAALTPFEIAAQNETRREVAAMLAGLNRREREVIALRFGLNDGEVGNLPQIGRVIGLSKQRVQVIERGALQKMGVMMSSDLYKKSRCV